MLLMNGSYGRIIQLHIALLAGGFLTITTGSTKITIVILVIAKLLMDLNYARKNNKTLPPE
jgi:hypothetical protein